MITLKKCKSVIRAYDENGNEITSTIPSITRHSAFKNGNTVTQVTNRNGKLYWKQIPMNRNIVDEVNNSSANVEPTQVSSPKMNKHELIKFIQNSHTIIPKRLEIDEFTWKVLIHSAVLGHNILIKGWQGCGKTESAYCLAEAMGKPFEFFNLGASQDSQGFFCGNPHKHRDGYTYFKPSRFAEAIQKPGNIILLDEINRANEEGWNILMSVLDPSQRYLTFDASEKTELIKVADGVTFILTANIGVSFTGTRMLDLALLDRMKEITIKPLSSVGEKRVLKHRFPDLSDEIINALADIAAKTRIEVEKENSELTNIISTRLNIAAAEMIEYGFSLFEAAAAVFFEKFDDDGDDSERSFIKKLVQSKSDLKAINKDGSFTDPFSPDDVTQLINR